MGIAKAISGHTSARGVMRYLERDGRALARDYLNIGAQVESWQGDLPRYGPCDWASEMDAVREASGNGTAWHGKSARTWKHYVLSPDPDNRVDLATLRELAVAWAHEHFPGYRVAIVYHDDNEGHIPHAHVVVNNTSLETGRRLQVPSPLALNRSFQSLEAERGRGEREAEAAALERVRAFAAEKGLLPEQSEKPRSTHRRTQHPRDTRRVETKRSRRHKRTSRDERRQR